MPPKHKKGKGRGKKTAHKPVGEEEVVVGEAVEDHEEEENDFSDSDHSQEEDERPREGVCKKDRKQREDSEEKLTHDEEQTLADWFATKPEFWDNTIDNFKNKTAKDRLLTAKATEMGRSRKQLDKWFKSQRTMYGRIRKSGKSGSGAKTMTSRRRWVLANFKYLASHVVVRSAASTLGMIHGSEPATSVHSDGDGSDMESRTGDPEKKPDTTVSHPHPQAPSLPRRTRGAGIAA